MSSTLTRFADAAPVMAANGYRVMPTMPRDKEPADGARQWKRYAYEGQSQEQFADCGVGIKAGGSPCLVGVDIDVRHPEMAAAIDALAVRMLGTSPRRVGQEPKGLRLYRCADPGTRKVQTLKYRLEGDTPDNKGNHVEVLANGQYFVAYGVHKVTGQPYSWDGGESPLTMRTDALPQVTAAQLQEFVAEAEELLALVGSLISRGQKNARTAAPLDEFDALCSASRRAVNLARVNAETLADLGSALKDIDAYDRDCWVRQAQRLRALGEAGYGLFDTYSRQCLEQYEDTPGDTRRVFESAAGDLTDYTAVFAEAARNGWVNPRSQAAKKGDPLAGVHPDIVAELRAVADDVLYLPGDFIPTPPAAERIFTKLGEGQELFTRGRRAVELDAATQSLSLVGADAFRSRLDRHGRRIKAAVKIKVEGQQNIVLAHKRCSHDVAELLLASRAAFTHLPPIALVAKSSVIVDQGGELLVLGPGYNAAAGGVLVQASVAPPTVPIKAAVSDLSSLLHDFQFAAPADLSRAIAGCVGPALRMGGLLGGHALVNIAEADESQTGKGYLQSIQRALYGERAYQVARRMGGVGSLDESIAAALVAGAPFISIDNIRGKIDSQYLESILTSHDPVSVRLPHKGEVAVDASRTVFQCTSNGIEATADLANRMLITRLRKRPPGYTFKRYTEGDALAHAIARQPHYLGCVFAVIRAWHAAGKPINATGHSFRDWCGVLDWIVQEVFGLPPLLADHEGAVKRVANPALSWLRQVAAAVLHQGRGGEVLSASALLDVAAASEIVTPGRHDPGDPGSEVQAVGRLLARCFHDGAALALDGVTIRRLEHTEYDSINRKDRTVRRYVFEPGVSP